MKNKFLSNLGNKDTTSPISNFLLVVMMYLMFFSQVYSYMGMSYTAQSKGSIAYEQATSGTSVVMLVTTVVLFCIIFLFFNTRFSTDGSFLLVTVVLCAGMLVWSVLASLEVGLVTLFYSSTPPWVYVTALMICVGLNEKLFPVFLRHAKIIGILSLIMFLITTVSFILSHGGCVLADCSNLRYYIQSFWLLCICSFFEEDNNKTFTYFCIVIFAVGSFAFSSRSWLIQSGLWLVSYAYFTQKNKSRAKIIKTLLALAVVAAVGFVIIHRYFPGLFEIFLNKGSPTHTRAFQYTDLFSQTSFGDFIIGNGYSFKYISSLTGEAYSYIDNAYLLMLVRYGIMVGISYPLIFVIPMLKNGFSKQSIPLALWLMALGGLSIFCATIIDLKSIALPVAAGRCMYLAKQKRAQKQALEEQNE